MAQWINDGAWTGGDGQTKSYSFPITFNVEVLIAILSGTIGRVAEGTSLEGAAVSNYTQSAVTLKCEWGGGFSGNKSISSIIIGR